MPQKPQKQSGQPASDARDPPPKSYEKTIARWTKVLGASTIVLAVATLVSAYFLYTAEKTIEKQVEAAGLQLRAYINWSQLLYAARFQADPNKPDELPVGVNVGVTWRNFGNTPAREASFWIAIKWHEQGTEPDFTKPSFNISDRSHMTLGPGTEVPTPLVFVPLSDVQKVMITNGGRIFFWGHISYRDYIPGSPLRHTHFCLVAVTLPATGLGVFNVYKPECNYST